MALYENKITLKGYLGKDAENITTKQQWTFTVLSLATKSGYKDKQTGQWMNHTEWHRIVAFGKSADELRAEGVDEKTSCHFTLDPTGNWLLCGNEDSATVTVFRRDLTTGRIGGPTQSIPLDSVLFTLFA